MAASLPLYTDGHSSLARGKQAEMLLAHLRAHAQRLSASGFTFGASRLAVIASASHLRRCRHCGMCLYGCPYGSIYNATHTLQTLMSSGKVDYRSGLYVDRLTETEGSVTIDFHERRRPTATGQLVASRVLVGCGAISSTRLMLASMGREQRAHRMRDSQYFVAPVLTSRAVPVDVATQGNTLAQLFLELDDRLVSEHAVHMQIYGYNDIMLSALAKRLPMRPQRVERLLRPLLGRMALIQGFLHSAESPGLTVTPEAKGIRVIGDDTAMGAARVKRIVRRLLTSARPLGMAPIPGLIHVGHPGKSNHLGASLPMRRDPGELEADTLGRVRSWNRVHLVDASIFPSLPATTVTISVMANAHRIASTVAEIETTGRS